jgi:cell division protein FtsB
MTPKLQQHVLPRNRSHLSASAQIYSRGSISSHTAMLTLGVLSLLACAGFGFFYLQQILTSAAQGSDVHAMEAKLNELKEKQRTLELEGAELRSIQAVEERVNKLNLVTVDSVAYLVPTSHQVALAD